MALGKNQRTDSRRSSSYCSTVTLVVFVAFCLVGVWIMTSFTVVPVEMFSSRSEVKDQVSDADSKPFEDSSGDVTEVTVKENTIIDAEKTSKSTADLPDQKLSEKSTVNAADSTQGDKDASFDTSKPQTYSDESGTGEGGEMAKPAEGLNTVGGDPNTEGRKDKQIEIAEQNTDETTNKLEENKAWDADQEAKNEQNNNSEENSMESIGNKERKQSDIDNSSTESQKQQSDIENNYGETVGDDKQQTNSEKDSKNTNRDEVQQSNNSMNSEQEIFSDVESVQRVNDLGQIKENMEQNQIKDAETNNGENKINGQIKNQGSNEVFPNGALSDLLNETNTTNGAWSTQAEESRNEKEVQASSLPVGQYSWKICNVTAGADYIPCLDNEQAIKKLPSTKHYEHRERHCPEEGPTCLVPLPNGYQRPIEWPSSREKIWYHNVPHTRLAVVKGHQNWVKVNGDHLIFPGGGTQFKHGALHYIDFIQESMPDIAWGKQSRVVLDVGCGVASFGGFLFDRDTLTMSFAPKDEHEAQVQFALERGIPAILAVMGTKRLPFPGRVFDVIHCARCRVPWHIEGGILLAELDRLLRPGGYFVWSATPVYQKNQEDQEIWNAMSALTKAMCWEMVAKRRDTINHVGLAIFKKPLDNLRYGKRKQNKPPLCQESDDPNAAWNIPLQACLHNFPVDIAVRGSQWPELWPQRLEKTPYWLNSSQIGVYGKPASEDFQEDYKHWKRIVSQSYITGMGINWATVRNVMDMRSVYGGFAAALRDMNVWVMNVVSIGSPDTLPIIYDRGLFGIYHDWCESFNTYPRTYDLLHADHLFSRIKRCKILSVFVEVDRMLRPEGKLIVRDTKKVINELEGIAISLNWEIRMTYAKDNEGLLCVQKTMWRPKDVDGNTSTL